LSSIRPSIIVSEALPEGWLSTLEVWCEAQGRALSFGIPPGSESLPEVDGLLTMLTVEVGPELLDRFPRLRVVSNMAVGHDNIDVAACEARAVAVGNTPGVLTAATADLTMALLLGAARRLETAARDAREGRWSTWSPTGWLGADLEGQTLGIVGMGKIGTAVARRAHGFGMQIIYCSRSAHAELEQELDARRVPLKELLAESDFVSLHVPLSDETRHLVGAPELRRMKNSALLINTARGGVIDQPALVHALREGWIAGAALDVTSPEPLPISDPLFAAPNCLVLPHIGSSTGRTRRRMAELACANLISALEDRPLPHAVLQAPGRPA
jgi:glyoxylate reductase